MGTIILIKYNTKLPIFHGFRVIISLPELDFFANIRFKSYLLNTFSSCLQGKEILFVQQRFRYSFAAERKKPGFGVANRPLRSPVFQYCPCILPRKQEKTSLVVVDKRGFFYGCGIGIRTPTNRVRVCRATVTQFRNASERMILYQILFFLSILFYDFVKKFTSALLLRNADAYPSAVGLCFSYALRALLRLRA